LGFFLTFNKYIKSDDYEIKNPLQTQYSLLWKNVGFKELDADNGSIGI
jgi:hypothetical protein